MIDLGTRLDRNPLLTPADVPPSMPGLEVVSVFNAAAARVGSEVVLLLRVAERPLTLTGPAPAGAKTRDLADPDSGLLPLDPGPPGEELVGLSYLDSTTATPGVVIAYIRRDLPGLDLSDPRRIRVSVPPSAAGAAPESRDYLTVMSHLRVARSADGVHFKVEPRPAVMPIDVFDEYGCEDPRATLIDGTWYVTYVSVGRLGITTSLLTTTDFRSYARRGIIFLPDHKDVAIFPGPVEGRHFALSRPMPSSFNHVLGIWIAESDDLLSWGSHRPLAMPRAGMWDELRTGASAVPFRVAEGWLEIYHGVDALGRYALGGLLLDGSDPTRVLARSPRPILEANEPYEVSGFYGNTVFSCGHVDLDEHRIRVYYGAADSCMAAADFNVQEIIDSLAPC